MLQITEYPVHFQLLDTVTCRRGNYESYVSELITSRWLSGADLPGAIPPPYMAASQKSRRQVDQKHVSSVPARMHQNSPFELKNKKVLGRDTA